MLSGKELLEYRQLRGLSLRDIEPYCQISIQAIGMVENGVRDVTAHNHQEIVNGINRAYFAKCNGTFKRPPIVKSKPVVKAESPKATPIKNPVAKSNKTKK